VKASATSTGGPTLKGGNTGGLHVLYTQGPFTLVGQCIIGSGGSNDVWAGTFLATSEPHGANGMLSDEYNGDLPDDSNPSTATPFNSASTDNPALVVEPAPTDEGPGVGGVVTGSTRQAFYGGDEDEGGPWSAVSSDLATALTGTSFNGANVGGPPTSDCVFTGDVQHN